MRTLLQSTAALLVLAAASAHAGDDHRHAGAHVHGHGTLGISVEGKRVTFDLEAPGADIVGFEHLATTPEQKAALAKAKATLSDPLALFKLPAAAGCKVAETDVEVEHDHGDHKEDAGHSGIEAEFELDCAAPDAITAIEFDYFKAFPNAKALSVELTTPKGQTKLEVTREKPRAELGGLM